MSNNRHRAKEIYFYYACNHFFLDRDGDSDEYKSFSVTAREEQEWRKEYIEIWINKLSVDDLHPIDRLRDAGVNEALPVMIKMADKGDSFSKLWFANAMYDMARWMIFSPILRFRAMSKAKNLWKQLSQNSIELTEAHRKEITRGTMRALSAADAEEYIRNYARRKLEEIR